MALHAVLARRAGGRGHARVHAAADAAVGLLAQARCADGPDPLATQARLDAGGPRLGAEAHRCATPRSNVNC
eukprot:2549732-Heterocapsa_arctica.AAC.1